MPLAANVERVWAVGTMNAQQVATKASRCSAFSFCILRRGVPCPPIPPAQPALLDGGSDVYAWTWLSWICAVASPIDGVVLTGDDGPIDITDVAMGSLLAMRSLISLMCMVVTVKICMPV